MLNVEQTIVSQYSESATIVQIIKGMDAWIDPSADIQTFYDYVFNVETAQGFGLDYWGKIVGVGRELTIENAADGDYLGFVETFIPVASKIFDFTNGTLDSGITFTRASSGTYVDSAGVLQTATTNTPRFDYDPVTLSAKGLLIEQQSTNLVLNSAALSTQTVTVTAVATTLSFYGTGTVVLSGVATGTVTGTGAYPTRTTYTFTPTAGSLVLTVTGSVTLAQLEAGSFATSYIPTTASQATRAADIAKVTGTDFSSWWNATEGTIYVEGDILVSSSVTKPFVVASNGTEHNKVMINARGDGNSGLTVNLAGVEQVNGASSTVTPLTSTKIAAVYKNSDFALSSSGASPRLYSSGTVPTVSEMRIGSRPAGAYLNGHIKSFKYWPKRLTNDQLKMVTA